MKHYKKSGFSVLCIECDREFKLIMDEVSDEMRTETNYTNIENYVPEAEGNIRVIKERFRIAYYKSPYKKIPMIMIHHLEMNLKRNFNMFPDKGGLLGLYITHTIMSHRNCDYNKH